MAREGAFRPRREGGDEDVQGAKAPGMELFREGLDADADERRQGARGLGLRDLQGGPLRVAVLLGVGTIAVAVLEVDAEVLHRLPLELGHHPRMDADGEVARQSEGVAEDMGVGGVLAQRAQRQLTELARGVGGEELGAAVHRVHGLTLPGVSRVLPRERGIGPLQAPERALQDLWRQGGLHATSSLRPWAAPSRCDTRGSGGRWPPDRP